MKRRLLIVLFALGSSACVIVPIDGPGGKSGGGTVLVCHKGKKTLELPREAAQAHYDHGDRPGPC